MDNALPISNSSPNALLITPLPQPLSYSYADPVYSGYFPAHGSVDFILIVVSFILLIIVCCSLFLSLKDVTVSIN
ncbi:YjcZ family sporulation protein [Neobacillus sp. Marseille-QA0830]